MMSNSKNPTNHSSHVLNVLQCCIVLCKYDLVVQGGGRLVHESVGDAIQTLNKKLKVSNIILKGGSSHCRAQDER